MDDKSVFLIIKKPGDTVVSNALIDCSLWLHQRGLKVMVEPTVINDLKDDLKFLATWNTDEELKAIEPTIFLIICLGGDGTLLWVSNLFKNKVPNIVSFSMGSLGFLTTFPISSFENTMNKIINGNFTTTSRNRLVCHVLRKEEQQQQVEKESFVCLNEALVGRGLTSTLSNLDCFVDDLMFTKIQADGLIISTPTGSTAYNLSAGGSMAHPDVSCILFTPVCPHSLSSRPLILPNTSKLQIQVSMNSRGSNVASFDGRQSVVLNIGDSLIVETSQWPLTCICSADGTTDWFESVSNVLKWNSRSNQKQINK